MHLLTFAVPQRDSAFDDSKFSVFLGNDFQTSTPREAARAASMRGDESADSTSADEAGVSVKATYSESLSHDDASTSTDKSGQAGSSSLDRKGQSIRHLTRSSFTARGWLIVRAVPLTFLLVEQVYVGRIQLSSTRPSGPPRRQ